MISTDEAQKEARAVLDATMEFVGLAWEPTSEIVPARCESGGQEGVWFTHAARIDGPDDVAAVADRLAAHWRAEGLDVRPSMTQLTNGPKYSATARARDVPWRGYEMTSNGARVFVQSRCAVGDVDEFDQ
jgi:hypothetical protein